MNKVAEKIIADVVRRHVVPAMIAETARVRIKATFLVNEVRTEFFVTGTAGCIEYGARDEAIQFLCKRDASRIRTLLRLLVDEVSKFEPDEAVLVGVELDKAN